MVSRKPRQREELRDLIAETRPPETKRPPMIWVLGNALTVAAVAIALAMGGRICSGAAPGDAPGMGDVAAEDLVATTVATDEGGYAKLLMLPLGQNPGVLYESNDLGTTFSLVRPGKSPTVLWSGQKYKAYVECAADGSGFILAEYDKAGMGRRLISVKVFDAAGNKIQEYVPIRSVYLLAALSNGAGLFAERNADGSSTYLLYDKSGKVAGEAGPFKAVEATWSADGSKLLVNIGEKPLSFEGYRSFDGPSVKILLVETKDGKVLYEFPPAYRGQLSPDGSLAATSGDKKLRFWKDGKEVKTFNLPWPATIVVFSPNGRYVRFIDDDGMQVYRTDNWMRTMTARVPEAGHKFDMAGGAVSNDGRTINRTYMPLAHTANQANLVCLYDGDGTLLWMHRYPWNKERYPLQGNPALTPDGKEAYLNVNGRVIRVATPAD